MNEEIKFVVWSVCGKIAPGVVSHIGPESAARRRVIDCTDIEVIGQLADIRCDDRVIRMAVVDHSKPEAPVCFDVSIVVASERVYP